MTVILGTNAGAPVLIGDMLLSVKDLRVPSDLQLPSQPRGIIVPPGTAAAHIPVAARRKTLVVNDHLAVGVAGSVTHLGSFLNELIGEFRHRVALALSDVKAFLERNAASTRGAEVLLEIRAIMAVTADGGSSFLIAGSGHAYSHYRSRHFGEVVAVGSGRESIVQEVRPEPHPSIGTRLAP